MKHKKIEW